VEDNDKALASVYRNEGANGNMVHSQFDVSGRPSSYLVEPAANRFGLINAFTNAAKKLGPLQRIEMERFAGTLLEAPLQ
jgi:hypothetical protein